MIECKVLAIAFGVLSLAAFIPKIASQTEEGVIVNIPGQGNVQGGVDSTTWTNQRILKFLSIPYAESPSGDRRFKASAVRAPWTETHDGTVFGKKCPTLSVLEDPSVLADPTNDVEDCLSVSVYTKSLTASQPVLFFIPGYGFLEGGAEQYRPNYLLHEDIVLVVLQYRVGPLGFLTTNSIDLPGNVGASDVIMALEWVQNNIHLFGGNKDLVTLHGHSSGAWIASGLLVSPQTENKNLFHRAIIQSGNILSNWEQETQLLTQAQRICRGLNCAGCTTSNQILQCVRNANVLDLLKASAKESFAPKIGDLLGILPREPFKLLETYNRNIPVLTGFTKQDGGFAFEKYYKESLPASGSYIATTVRDFATGLIDKVNDTSGMTNDGLIRLAFDYTPGILDTNDHRNAIPAYLDISSIIFTKSPVINMAKNIASKNTAGVYLYTFDYIGNHSRFSNEIDDPSYTPNSGVNHCQDNIYLFAPYNLNEKDTLIAQKMTSLWTSFARNGVPSGLQDDMALSPMSSDIGPYFHINEQITEGINVLQELTVTLDDPNKKTFPSPFDGKF